MPIFKAKKRKPRKTRKKKISSKTYRPQETRGRYVLLFTVFPIIFYSFVFYNARAVRNFPFLRSSRAWRESIPSSPLHLRRLRFRIRPIRNILFSSYGQYARSAIFYTAYTANFLRDKRKFVFTVSHQIFVRGFDRSGRTVFFYVRAGKIQQYGSRLLQIDKYARLHFHRRIQCGADRR